MSVRYFFLGLSLDYELNYVFVFNFGVFHFLYQLSSRVLTPTEEVIQRIQSDPSVQGFLIVDSKGIIKRSSVDLARALDYKVATKKLVSAARYAVKNLDPRDDLKFLRIRTKNTEIMLGPENGDTLVVIQSLPNMFSKEIKDEGLKKD